MPLVTMLGLIGNILSILVLRSPRIDMKVTFKKYVTYFIIMSTNYGVTYTSGHWDRPSPPILDTLSLHVLRHIFITAGALVVVTV